MKPPRALGRLRSLALTGILLLAGAAGASAASNAVTSQKLTGYRTCALTALSGAGSAGADAWVDQANAGSNEGTGTSLNVRSFDRLLGLVPPDRNRRTYVRFDLTKCAPAIAASATVHAATLRLRVASLAGGCRTQDVFRVTPAWVETTITWNNQPFGTTNNNPASGSRTDAANVGGAPCANSTSGAYVGWNVTADVAAFVAGTSTNNGWMIRDDVELSGAAQENVYSAREQNSVLQSPQLVIVYR